jgi:hypothetical protein
MKAKRLKRTESKNQIKTHRVKQKIIPIQTKGGIISSTFPVECIACDQKVDKSTKLSISFTGYDDEGLEIEWTDIDTHSNQQ